MATVKKSPDRNDALKLYMATMGYAYPGCDNGKFYPVGMPVSERLKYYSSKFNSVVIRPTFFSQPRTDLYRDWLESVAENKEFKFIITAPKIMSYAKTIKDIRQAWSFFWNGNHTRGGCKLLHEAGKLACVLIEFPSFFGVSQRNVNRIKSLMKTIPEDVRCAVEFRHWSWWENLAELKSLFESYPRWCIATQYVENGLVECGWAGNLPSTRVKNIKEAMQSVPTTDFIFMSFYGTMGKYLGSYDDGHFLEKLVSRIKSYQSKGVKTVYCSFNNTESSYCYPLPGIFVMGFPLQPRMKELPFHTQIDLPCCLHDTSRFEKIWEEIEECPYKTDDKGYVEIDFQ